MVASGPSSDRLSFALSFAAPDVGAVAAVSRRSGCGDAVGAGVAGGEPLELSPRGIAVPGASMRCKAFRESAARWPASPAPSWTSCFAVVISSRVIIPLAPPRVLYTTKTATAMAAKPAAINNVLWASDCSRSGLRTWIFGCGRRATGPTWTGAESTGMRTLFGGFACGTGSGGASPNPGCDRALDRRCRPRDRSGWRRWVDRPSASSVGADAVGCAPDGSP